MSGARLRSSLLAALGGAALLAAAGCTGEDGSGPREPRTGITSHHGELVVDFVDGTTLAEVRERFSVLAGRDVSWNSPNVADEAIAVVSAPVAEQPRLLDALRGDPLVESAEHNGLYRIEPPALLSASGRDAIPDDEPLDPRDGFPNDPLFEKQWHMEMARAVEAWDFATGDEVIVAVIDTGVAYEEKKGLWAPDLKRTRFVPGYDFVGDDAVAADDHGHGTHCAGTIAQSTDNEIGVVGLAPDARVMPLKVLSKGGFGTASDIADAIRYAADHGAHVLSLSLGGGGYSRVMANAVRYAHAQGCAVVCAAGNAGRPKVEYPAAYPGAFAVSSVGKSGKLAFYSSHGKETFLAAPGGDKRSGPEGGVLQNTLDPQRSKQGKTVYAYFQGTSMATPHVSAACALLYDAGVTRPDAVRDVLAATAATPAEPGTEGWTPKYGHGILDAGAAVRYAVFAPGFAALVLAAVLVLVAIRRTSARDLGRGLLIAGAVLGSVGLFFLRPLGLAELPLLGPLLVRAPADWDTVLLGPAWHWSPLFASALIPGFVGLVTLAARPLRSFSCGLALGWSAHLASGVLFPFADVRWVPGAGVLDALWLGLNALALLAAAAVFVRLGRGKEGIRP